MDLGGFGIDLSLNMYHRKLDPTQTYNSFTGSMSR